MESKQKTKGPSKLLKAIAIGATVGTSIGGVINVVSTMSGYTGPATMPVVLRQAVQTVERPSPLHDASRPRRPNGIHGAAVASKEEARVTGWHQLAKSIRWVESSGDDAAIGDGGLAVGAMQIHPITVKDVNRIVGWNQYTLADRYDAGKSIEMFMIKSKFYANHLNEWSAEGIARRWNGNPLRGHKQQATLKYWRKVQKHYEL